MAGHSKWANIKRTKEANDKKKSKNFSKLSKDITIAARLTQVGDLNMNPILKAVVDKAKSANMTNDKITRAINKGLGINDQSDIIYSNTYEAYFNNVPLLIDVETDNTNRSLTEIRTIIVKSGGKLVPEGSLSWNFEELGELVCNIDLKNSEKIILDLMELDGFLDYEESEESLKIYVEKDKLKLMNDTIRSMFSVDNLSINEVSLIKRIKDKTLDSESLSEDSLTKLSDLVDLIESNEDVVGVWVGI